MYWLAEMKVFAPEFTTVEYFEGDFDDMREMIESVQDEFVQEFGDAVSFDTYLKTVNV